MAAELKGMLKAGVTEPLKVSVGWLAVDGAEVEVVRVPPKPLKPPVPLLLLLATVWAKEVLAAGAAVVAAGLPNWKMEDRAGAEVATVAGGPPPNTTGWEVEVMVLLAVLATALTPKPNTGFEAETVVLEATVEVAVAKPVKRGTGVTAVVAAAAVCFTEKGPDRGMDVIGSTLSKMGLKAGAVVLAAVVRVVPDEAAVVVAEEPDGTGLAFSLLGVAIKMGLNMGEQAGPGVAGEEEDVAGGFSIPNSMLGFGVGDGAVEAGVLAACSA